MLLHHSSLHHFTIAYTYSLLTFLPMCSLAFPFELVLFDGRNDAMTLAIKGCFLLCIHLCHSSKYLTIVDQIEDLLGNAVRLHRSGQAPEAVQVLKKIRANFESAVQLEPALPDAYVAFAQAMLASNNLKESIDAWESALERMDEEKDASMFAWAKGRLRWARYGVVSMKRDALYAHGQGDLMESKKLVEEQLQIYPDFPSRQHDLATIRVMLSEFGDDAEVVENFRSSQENAWRSWMAGLLERNRCQQESKLRRPIKT